MAYNPDQAPQADDRLKPFLIEDKDGALSFTGATLGGLKNIDSLGIEAGDTIFSKSGTSRKILGIDRKPHENGGYMLVEKVGAAGVGQEKIPFSDFFNVNWVDRVDKKSS